MFFFDLKKYLIVNKYQHSLRESAKIIDRGRDQKL